VDTATESWPQPVLAVMDALEEAGFEAYVVGGCVRDLLMHRPIHDYDIATNALPEQVQRLFAKVKTVGLKHGTVTVVMQHVPIEITTYRADGPYTDGRHPATVEYKSRIDEDLARRDYTINAMAMDRRGHLRDRYGGRQHLEQRLLCPVGAAGERFQEDSLRILRGFRLQAQLGFSINSETYEAMWEHAGGLARISAERIGEELTRMVLADWWRVRGALAEGPWLTCTNPPLEELRRALQQLQAYDRFSEQWYAACQTPGADTPVHNTAFETCPEVRRTAFMATVLAALTDASVSSPAITTHTWNLLTSHLRRLSWPKAVVSRGRRVAELLLAEPQTWSRAQWRRRLFEEDPSEVGLSCRLADWWALNTIKGTSGGAGGDAQGVTAGAMFFRYAAEQPLFGLGDLRIDGHALVALGASGPSVGRIKQILAEEVLRGALTNHRNELTARAATLVQDAAENEGDR